MPVPVQHPHWCDGVDCTVTGDPYRHGFHWSMPAHLEPDPRTGTSATVRIAQGTPVQGQTLTGSTGSWTGVAVSYSYQWKRCDLSGSGCSSIAGATGGTYALGAADVATTVHSVGP